MSDWDTQKELESIEIDKELKNILDNSSNLTRLSPYWRVPIYKVVNQAHENTIIKFIKNSEEDKLIEIINTKLEGLSPKILDIKSGANGIFISYEFIEGVDLLDFLLKENESEQLKYFEQMGEIISRFHGLDVSESKISPKSKLHKSEFEFIDEDLRNKALSHVSKIESLEIKIPVLSHGDFGPQQFLKKDDGSLILIDWEKVRLSTPEEDLGWFLWTTFHKFSNFSELVQSFKVGYSKYSEWNFKPELLQSFAVAKIWEVLPEFNELPHQDIKIEWGSRLKKAIGKSFLDKLIEL